MPQRSQPSWHSTLLWSSVTELMTFNFMTWCFLQYKIASTISSVPNKCNACKIQSQRHLWSNCMLWCFKEPTTNDSKLVSCIYHSPHFPPPPFIYTPLGQSTFIAYSHKIISSDPALTTGHVKSHQLKPLFKSLSCPQKPTHKIVLLNPLKR